MQKSKETGNPVVYIWNSMSLLFLSGIHTSMHSHYAYEIYISKNSFFEMDFGFGLRKYNGIIINSDVPHKFSSKNGTCLLILINPAHSLAGKYLRNILNSKPYKEFDSTQTEEIISDLYRYRQKNMGYNCAINHVSGLLKIISGELPENCFYDSRIEKAITLIHKTYKENFTLSFLASEIGLSKSRIRHLFKEQTGITISKYILNIRLIEAIKIIINGYTKTYAAHESGFSDSAHLSRTFKRIYGLTLSDIYKNRHKIISDFIAKKS